MVGFDENSSATKVNEALKPYGFDLKNVEYILREVKATYSLTNWHRNIPQLEREISQLSSMKERLVKLVDDFIKASKRWEKLQPKLFHKTSSTKKKEIVSIEKELGLESFFEKIDRKVNHLKKSILLSKNLSSRIAGEKKLVSPHTIVILVWVIAMQHEHGKRSEIFEVVVTLLEWLSKHRRVLLMETIGQERKYLTPDAIRRDYERYISNPSEKMKVYSELAFSIYAESFSEQEN